MALRVKRHNFTACFVVDKGARYITPPLIWVPDTSGSERCPNLWPLGGNLKKSIPRFTPHCPPMPPSSDVSYFHICWKLSCQLLNTSSILTPLGNHGLNLKRMWAKEVDKEGKIRATLCPRSRVAGVNEDWETFLKGSKIGKNAWKAVRGWEK